MNGLTAFDWIVLAGLVLLVAVWLVRRIRTSLRISRCSRETSSCAGCSGGCGKRGQAGACSPTAGDKKPD